MIRRLLSRGDDPYLGNDLGNANRLVGLSWLVYGAFAAVILTLAPPGSEIKSTGSVIAIAIVMASVALGLSLLRRAWAGFNALLIASYTMVGALAALQAVANDGGAYHELYLLLMTTVAASHPVRRVVPFVVFMTAVALGPLVLGSPAAGALADFVVRLAMWTICSALLMVIMAQLRTQRLAIRLDGEHAQELARTDSLTGLGNRRQLVEDLDSFESAAPGGPPYVLALFDLDGFKAYNDAFGHPAGDALLRRLGEKLSASVTGAGRAYRMGGDEFCVLGPLEGAGNGDLGERAAAALVERGEGFTVRASHGSVLLPIETGDPAEAMRLADRRMYAQKNLGRASAGRQTTDVLLRVLAERSPALGDHMNGVTELCQAVAERLELPEEETTPLLQAASLHDIGKSAIPDAILNKPGPLTEEEWAFMRRHTLIGERILAVAPALTRAASLVRSSHERYSGGGYPDGLAGESIPLGARIIAACDAYDAMRSDRPYRTTMSEEAAIKELRGCSGAQFDPAIVEAVCGVLRDRRDAAAPVLVAA